MRRLKTGFLALILLFLIVLVTVQFMGIGNLWKREPEQVVGASIPRVLVTIATQPQMGHLRQFVSSATSHSSDDVSIVVYGIGLKREHRREIQEMDRITLMDVSDIDFSTDWTIEELMGLGSDAIFTTDSTSTHQHKHGGVLEPQWYHLWQLVSVMDAAQRFGSVLFVDVNWSFAKDLDGMWKVLEDRGYLFTEGNGGCSLSVQGYNSVQSANEILLPLVECALNRACYMELWPKYLMHGGLPRTGVDTDHTCISSVESETVLGLQVVPIVEPEPTPASMPLIYPDSTPIPVDISDNESVTTIALLVPSTTKGMSVNDYHTLPLFTIFIPSFKDSVDTADKRYTFVIYLGYDEGDAYYDDDTVQKAISDGVTEASAEWPLSYKGHRVIGAAGSPCWVWNSLFKVAYDDKCDYFYQLNDDIMFVTKDWAPDFVETLRSNPRLPNFGATGPRDQGNIRTMTQSFVSRIHYDIFGTYYPEVFKNWYSDDWISWVYGAKDTIRPKPFEIQNMNPHGTRYVIKDARDFLTDTLVEGCIKIQEYLKERGVDDGWYCDDRMDKSQFWWDVERGVVS